MPKLRRDELDELPTDIRNCMRKIRYCSREKAQTAIWVFHGNEKGLHVYYCTFCGYFHIGHDLGIRVDHAARAALPWHRVPHNRSRHGRHGRPPAEPRFRSPD